MYIQIQFIQIQNIEIFFQHILFQIRKIKRIKQESNVFSWISFLNKKQLKDH